METRNRLIGSLALAGVMALSLSNVTLGNEPDFGLGDQSSGVNDACAGATEISIENLTVLADDPSTDLNEAGYRAVSVNGVLHQGFHRVDAQGNSITQEFDVILPQGTYLIYPDVRGTGWLYNTNCDPKELVLDHIQKRIDAEANTFGQILSLDTENLNLLFVHVGDADSGPDLGTTDGSTDPDTTVAVVNLGTGLCPTDVNTYGDLLDVCVDDTNEVAMAGNCFIHQSYLQEGGPEVSTSGGYVSVRYTMKSGKLRWVLLSHGLYNVASRLPNDAWVSEYGVNCLFTEVLAFITADIQTQQNNGKSIADIQVVAWNHSNGLFGLETTDLPYFGGTMNPDTDPSCHAQKEKGGIMERHSVIGKDGFYTLVEPWMAGRVKEFNSVLDPGQWHVANGVQGSFWYYNKDLCSRGEVEAQAQAESNRRGRHSIGYFQNANHFGAFFRR